MLHIGIDEYVFDVLMPDLVGHDHSPSAFLVYLFLWCKLYRSEQKRIAVSLQQIAEGTGLSKSAVQAGLRILKRRRLVQASGAHARRRPITSCFATGFAGEPGPRPAAEAGRVYLRPCFSPPKAEGATSFPFGSYSTM